MHAYIDNYRRELPVALLTSPYNKLKSMKRLKTYIASLSDAATIEDHEDASIQSSSGPFLDMECTFGYEAVEEGVVWFQSRRRFPSHVLSPVRINQVVILKFIFKFLRSLDKIQNNYVASQKFQNFFNIASQKFQKIFSACYNSLAENQ